MASENSQVAVHGRGTGTQARSSYLSESIAELKKVSFPTRQETLQATIVTLVIVAFVSISLFVLDVVFNQLMNAILL